MYWLALQLNKPQHLAEGGVADPKKELSSAEIQAMLDNLKAGPQDGGSVLMQQALTKGLEQTKVKEAEQTQLIDPATANANQALGQQQLFTQALGNQGGFGNQQQAIANQNAVFGQQQALANQLQERANGGGPNPAAIALQQATNANTANAAAGVASQRGLNAGQAARMIGQNTAQANQQAAGQSALMQAQQQIAAQQQLQQQQGMLGNLAGQQANVAGQQIGQLSQGLGNLNSLAQSEQNTLINQDLQHRQLAMTGNLQDKEHAFQQAQDLTNTGKQITGGAVSGIAGGLMSGGGGKQQAVAPTETPAAARGGMLMAYAEGGQIATQAILKENYKGPKSRIAQHLAGGGIARNMVSGGHVPGKPKVGGAKDSYANDTVDAKLSPGEIVIPRSITMSKDPINLAAQFVKATLAKKGKK